MHLVEIKEAVEASSENAGEQLVKLLLEVDALAEGLHRLLANAKVASIRGAARDVSALAQAMRLGISLNQDGSSLADTARRLSHAACELKLLTDKSRLDATARAGVVLLNNLAPRLRDAALTWAGQGIG